MADIFISYARSDRQRAKVLAEALEKRGYDVWWDPHIPPGKTFARVIEEALEQAKCVVVLWSRESAKSDWVQTEAAEGKRRKILIPALIEDANIPLEFRRIQAADLRDWQRDKTHFGFTNLLQALSEIVGPPPAKELARKAEEEKRRKEQEQNEEQRKRAEQLRLEEKKKIAPQRPEGQDRDRAQAKRKKTIVFSVVGAVLLLLVGSLLVLISGRKGTRKVTPVELKSPYKVGAVFSVTGSASFIGEPEKKTAEMIAEEVNNVGGIHEHPLELIVYDDESDETKCVLAVKRLIRNDKVPVIIGPSLSGNTLAVVKIVNDAEVPLVSCAASFRIVTPVVDRKWVFKVPQSDTHAVEKVYSYLLKNGINKIAIMSVTTAFGASGREELLRLAPRVGIKIVADERYGPKDTDITAQLKRIRVTDAQAIVNWSVGPTQALAVKNWRDLGMTKIPFYQSHGFCTSRKNIELAAGAAEGVFCPQVRVNIPDLVPADHPQKKVIDAYNKSFQKKFNEPVSSFGGHAWDALNLVLDAMKAVGPDSAKIRDYIETRTNFVGQHGVFNFSPTDHNGLTKEAFIMVVVKNGKWALAPNR